MRGSIRQRSKGSWTLIYDTPSPPGERRHQKYETIHGCKRDAERLLAQRLQEIGKGVYCQITMMTFAELAQKFLQARSTRVAITSYDLYSRIIRCHLQPVLAGMRIDAIRVEHVEALLSGATNHSRTTRSCTPLSSGTLQNILTTLRSCLAYAVRNDWLLRNVALQVQAPSAGDAREPLILTAATVQRVLNAMRHQEVEAPAICGLGTGARRGELCGLQWGDIDLHAERYTIRRTAANVRKRVIYKQPKSKTSRRTDALPPSIAEFLRCHRSAQQRLWSHLGLGKLTDSDFVFTRGDGTAWDPNELSRQFSRLMRRHNVKSFRFHDLRHAHASLAFAAGVQLRTISESMGHASIAITSSTYIHLLEEGRRDKAARIDSFLRDSLAVKTASI